MYRFAFLAAVVANASGSKKRYKAEDFIGKPPERKKAARSTSDLAALVAEAKAKGLRVPSL